MTTGRLYNPGTATHSYIISPLCHPSAGPFSCNRSMVPLHIQTQALGRKRRYSGRHRTPLEDANYISKRPQLCFICYLPLAQLQTGLFMRCIINHLPLNSQEDPLTLTRDTTHKHCWAPALLCVDQLLMGASLPQTTLYFCYHEFDLLYVVCYIAAVLMMSHCNWF